MDLSPVSLPEVDRPVLTWAMCRNPMCPNFGKPYDPHAPRKRKNASGDSRYTYTHSDGRIQCRYCDQSFAPKSNQAVRPIVRYYLSLSLPFAACDTQTCPNYGRNVFEVYAKRGSRFPRYYTHQGNTNVLLTCRECKESVVLGEYYGLTRGDKEVNRTVDFIALCVQLGVKKRRTIHYGRMHSSAYTSRLHRIGARVQDYHAWRNAQMFDPESKVDFSQPARVYTDVMTATLRKRGDVDRYQHLKFIVSVLALKDTFSGVCATSIYVL